jgi:hypothetical protein
MGLLNIFTQLAKENYENNIPVTYYLMVTIMQIFSLKDEDLSAVNRQIKIRTY